MTRWRAAIACAACLAGGWGVAAAPINFTDHLQCMKVEDSVAKTQFSASVASNDLGFQPGCVVTLPAKLVCVASVKSDVSRPRRAPLQDRTWAHGASTSATR